MGSVTPEGLRAWVVASCAAQGVPLHVTDPRVLEQVRVLLTGGAGSPAQARQRERGGPARRSQPPDDLEPVGVQGAGAAGAGAHQNVIDDGFDDGDLASEVEGLPRGA